MAKLSARGSFKLAEAFRELSDEDNQAIGCVTRHIVALRSDGALLLSHSFPRHPWSHRRTRSAYKVLRARIDASTHAERRELFGQWCERKGFEVQP